MDDNTQLELILIEIQIYVDQLNETLKTSIPQEIVKTRESCKEILTLAGEFNDYLSK